MQNKLLHTNTRYGWHGFELLRCKYIEYILNRKWRNLFRKYRNTSYLSFESVNTQNKCNSVVMLVVLMMPRCQATQPHFKHTKNEQNLIFLLIFFTLHFYSCCCFLLLFYDCINLRISLEFTKKNCSKIKMKKPRVSAHNFFLERKEKFQFFFATLLLFFWWWHSMSISVKHLYLLIRNMFGELKR